MCSFSIFAILCKRIKDENLSIWFVYLIKYIIFVVIKIKIMEDLELISLSNECNKMSVLEVSNYLLGKMDYLSRIKSDKSNKILNI